MEDLRPETLQTYASMYNVEYAQLVTHWVRHRYGTDLPATAVPAFARVDPDPARLRLHLRLDRLLDSGARPGVEAAFAALEEHLILADEPD